MTEDASVIPGTPNATEKADTGRLKELLASKAEIDRLKAAGQEVVAGLTRVDLEFITACEVVVPEDTRRLRAEVTAELEAKVQVADATARHNVP